MNLSPTIQAFVLHFGEMGNRWGINRTVGQIYALLYVSPKPLCADAIVEALGIDPEDAAPDHWRHVHARLLANEPPRPYTQARHRAWLKRRHVTP